MREALVLVSVNGSAITASTDVLMLLDMKQSESGSKIMSYRKWLESRRNSK